MNPQGGRGPGHAMSRQLHLRSFGPADGPPLVCLHGVTAWGGHFAALADRLGTHRVLAPDLLGHGDSPYEPPWRVDEHVAALAATLDVGSAAWLGHSFGARLALEHAAREPASVEKLVLLDPAVVLPTHVALQVAEQARTERRYTSFAEAIDRRYDESQLHGAPRALVEAELRGHLVEGDDGWRYRYSQASVVAAYAELAVEPPPFDAVRLPTLVVLGRDSYLPYEPLLGAHRAALGELLEVVTVAGGHTLLWDALDETARAIERFLD